MKHVCGSGTFGAQASLAVVWWEGPSQYRRGHAVTFRGIGARRKESFSLSPR